MAGWVVQPEVVAENWTDQSLPTDLWNSETPVIAEQWTVTPPLDFSAEGNEWTRKALVMNPQAAANRNTLNAGDWTAEENNTYPENDIIFPEFSQDDNTGNGDTNIGWVIQVQETD